MTETRPAREYGRLASPDVLSRLGGDAILCLPIGSFEQHGPHLPLHTDATIADRFTELLVERYGESHNLWKLPLMPYGLAMEHKWAAGTISLDVEVFSRLLDVVVGEYAQATPARRLLIVNGHGGNRGILEAVLYELQIHHGIAACVIHPSPLSTIPVESALPEVHGGKRETSVMLYLAPTEVHLDRLPEGYEPDLTLRDDIRGIVLDRGTTWPWSSNDPRISSLGIIGGDPKSATRDLGMSVMHSALDGSQAVLDQLSVTKPSAAKDPR